MKCSKQGCESDATYVVLGIAGFCGTHFDGYRQFRADLIGEGPKPWRRIDGRPETVEA